MARILTCRSCGNNYKYSFGVWMNERVCRDCYGRKRSDAKVDKDAVKSDSSGLEIPDDTKIETVQDKSAKELKPFVKETKRCPYCGEEILAVAIKCKHCQTMLEDAPPASGSTPSQPQAPFDDVETHLPGMEPTQPARAQSPTNLDGVETIEFDPSAVVLSGRYELAELLGRGGFGEVYRALDKELENDVAIKLLPQNLRHMQKALDLLKREARVAINLSHQRIVKLMHYDERGSFLVMEYMPGQDVGGRLCRDLHGLVEARDDGLSEEEATRIILQVLESLNYAHSLKEPVIHRDLKPGNILLMPDGNVKVGDFGLAKVLRDSLSGLSLSRASGTPQYMSPEQCLGERMDARGDIYSVGMTFYELLVGRTPFADADITALPYCHKHEPVKPIEGISDRLNEIILKCVAKAPEDRWQSAQELTDVLEGKIETETEKRQREAHEAKVKRNEEERKRREQKEQAEAAQRAKEEEKKRRREKAETLKEREEAERIRRKAEEKKQDEKEEADRKFREEHIRQREIEEAERRRREEESRKRREREEAERGNSMEAFCVECGGPIELGARFCGSCGTELSQDTKPIKNMRWTCGPGEIARRVEEQELEGIIRKGLIVEHGTRAIFLQRGRIAGVLEPGFYNISTFKKRLLDLDFSVPTTVILLQAADIEVNFQVSQLLSKEDVDLSVQCKLVQGIEKPEFFFTNLMRQRHSLTKADVQSFLEREMTNVLQPLIRAESVNDLYANAGLKRRIEQAIESEMRMQLGRNGLRLIQLRFEVEEEELA